MVALKLQLTSRKLAAIPRVRVQHDDVTPACAQRHVNHEVYINNRRYIHLPDECIKALHEVRYKRGLREQPWCRPQHVEPDRVHDCRRSAGATEYRENYRSGDVNHRHCTRS
ncbi:hypothetical protein DPMN_153423 [Dreissena polymorpha]|uniref:Uncharacterized protein n=1 Tax=Dreissena polymorpha TaxID=45954 RepID=A0A9D4J9D6_DREPO|nr:hypothetical protein DPMN_153423 [Dreissena polymorpha]